MHPLIESHLEAIRALCQHYGVTYLALFGSAAKGTFKPGESDLDFLVDFRFPFDMGGLDQYFGFKFALEELFRCSVDLVEREAIRSETFRSLVEPSKQVVYESAIG